MPIGPGGGGGGDAARRQPQLAAAPKRSAPPLTPKVAGRHAAVAQSAVSPLSRTRDADAASSLAPSAPFVANVTPRSGSRQGKMDGAATTPNGTPNPDRNQDAWDNNLRISVGSGTSTKGQDAPSQEDSKFFYASDAKSQQQATAPRPPSVAASTKASGDRFHYANNSASSSSSSVNKRTISPPTSHGFQPMLASTPEPTASKFFYANGAPDISRSGSLNSSTSRLAQGPRPTSAASNATRPMSPSKPTATPSSLKGSAMPPSVSSRPPITSPPSLAPIVTTKENRRVSIEAPSPRSKKRHTRAGSVPTFETLSVPKNIPAPQSPPALETASAPLSPGLAQPAMTMASLLQAVEDLAEDDDENDGDDDKGESSGSDVKAPGSPTKEPVSDLVANARRERKVQDLEITNASLEAINRTLERKLRKQTTELRRFRRLSRAGRLSGATSAATSRATSAAISQAPVDLSDLSEDDGWEEFDEGEEEEEEESPEESDFESDETSTLEDPANPSEKQQKQLARRKKDEDRLQLDLSKHQQLLVDTQKINQSIKRCLDWTEVLIKEGQKALEYKVGVSEVHFGGRVLAPPDEDDDALSSIQDDNSVVVTDMTDSTTTLERPTLEHPLEPPLAKSFQDNRDSGIELQVAEAG